MINAAVIGFGTWGKTMVESLAAPGASIRISTMQTRTVKPDDEAFANAEMLGEKLALGLVDLDDGVAEALGGGADAAGKRYGVVDQLAGGERLLRHGEDGEARRPRESRGAECRKRDRGGAPFQRSHRGVLRPARFERGARLLHRRGFRRRGRRGREGHQGRGRRRGAAHRGHDRHAGAREVEGDHHD